MLAIIWMGLIFRMSSMPGGQVPGRFSTLAHFLEYAVLAGLLILAMRRGRIADRALLGITWASAYGLTDELHQAFVQARSPDPIDYLVDTSGALLAAILIGIALSYRQARLTQ